MVLWNPSRMDGFIYELVHRRAHGVGREEFSVNDFKYLIS
jgi:hypothetical protein